MKSRARATATGVSVGLTVGALVWACTSLPEIAAIPTDAGPTCQSFLAATKLPGRWAFGPLGDSAVTYMESAQGDREVAWVGKCNGAIEPTVYRTPLARFTPAEDAITQFPAGDLCVGAKPFGPPIAVQGFEEIITLVPSDRNPTFLCALLTKTPGVAPPFGLSRVVCMGSDPTVKAPDSVSGAFIGLFRSKEFGPSNIRGAFAGTDPNSSLNTFVASEADGTVVL
jgi:hypothetical protein